LFVLIIYLQDTATTSTNIASNMYPVLRKPVEQGRPDWEGSSVKVVAMFT